MRHFIGHLLGENIQDYYQEITTDLADRFDVKNLSNRVPAHLTLKYSFESDDTSGIEKAIRGFVKQRTPISYNIEGFDRFDDNIETIFLSINPTRELSKFTEDCIIELGDLHENKKFDPKKFRLHASVAYHLSPEMFNSLWEYVRTLQTPYFEQKFDNVTLFMLENEVWIPRRIFEIK